MPTNTCNECGTPVADYTEYCDHCLTTILTSPERATARTNNQCFIISGTCTTHYPIGKTTCPTKNPPP